MVSPAAPELRAELLSRWQRDWPQLGSLGQPLIELWSQPARHYHGLQHLAECLVAADRLGCSPVEAMALWFHDVVHANQPGIDERASAALAQEWLSALPGQAERPGQSGLKEQLQAPAFVAEVGRLILATVEHQPPQGDLAAARVCDADLAVLAAGPARYAESVRQLHQEWPALTDAQWRGQRRRVVLSWLSRPIFHSPWALEHWEPTARANLAAELNALDGLDARQFRDAKPA